MNQYTVTFKNGTVRDIPGTDLADARRYAESCGPVASIAPKMTVHDFDRGFGIGGLGLHEEPPVIPTEAALRRVERLEATDTICQRCGASRNFDGAMFTTGGGNICDDCFG